MIRRCRHLWMLLALLTVLPAALQAGERVMVGDNIYVGPDEVLDEAVCILCSIRVDGEVGDAVAILGSVQVNGESRGDVVAILGGVKINGVVEGDTVAILGGGEISGEVGGDAVAILGGLNLRDGASIDGDTVSVMGGMHRDGSVAIGGESVQESGPPPGAILLFVVAALVGLIIMVAFGPVVAAITLAIAGEKRIETIRDTLNQRLGMCFLIGLGVFVGSFVLSIVLQVVMFWAPGVEAPIGLAMFVVSAVGYTGLGLWVGRGLVRTGSAMGATILGAILITFVQLIPLIGWFLLWPIFGSLAIGAAVLSGFGTSVDWLLARAETEPIARPLPR